MDNHLSTLDAYVGRWLEEVPTIVVLRADDPTMAHGT